MNTEPAPDAKAREIVENLSDASIFRLGGGGLVARDELISVLTTTLTRSEEEKKLLADYHVTACCERDEARENLSTLTARLKEAVESANHRLAWLVENGKAQGHGLQYLSFSPELGMFTWVDDFEKALQLSRRIDAELVCQECEDHCSVVEHSFLAASTPVEKKA